MVTYGPMNPPDDRCAECDRLIEVDEPQTCYFTGGGPCGDCRDPRTNKPPMTGGCFRPMKCVECEAELGGRYGYQLLEEGA
jgi:hypothetical protein